MQRKRSNLILPLISASILSGCAAQATDRYAPAPQALIEAAEQASQMRMVYADIQARANGYTVDNVRLDARDADAPEFMRAKVRLDYNGPMDNVLTRVSNDIGYRLNEYAKPASGLSWTPWIRLSGNKTLLDHLREMNSQVPWHIVLDHRDRRLVVDYSDDGGMASQIMRAQEKLRDGSGRGVRNLPTGGQSSANRAKQATAETLSNNPTLPHAEPYKPAAPSEVWFVAVEGYESAENARAMVSWLAQLNMKGYVHDGDDGSYDARVIAESSRDALALRKTLTEHGVPSELDYESPSDDADLKRRAEQAMRDGWPIDSAQGAGAQASSGRASRTSPAVTNRAPETEVRWMTPDDDGASSASKSTSKPRITSRSGGSYEGVLSSQEAARIKKTQWTVQLSHSGDMSGLKYAGKKVEKAGYSAAILPYSDSKKQLRAIGFSSRSEASKALRVLRGSGFSDAYMLSPKGE